MKKGVISYKLWVISFIVCVFLIYHLALINNNYCYAQKVVSSQELITNAKEYDGELIVYEGELIGEPLKRKQGMWMNIHDQRAGALGVWIPQPASVNIHYAGGYNIIGDRLRIMGEFHRACIEHGGDLDIHAQEINQIEPGRIKPQESPLYKRRFLTHLSVILLCLLLILLILGKKLNRT